MFGIGAFELFAILVIALIVLGPDRLPKAMGQVGRWIRELRRITREFREEFSEEIQLLQGEIENLREEAELTRQELKEIQEDIRISMQEVQGEVQQAGEDIRTELTGTEADLAGAAQGGKGPVPALPSGPGARASTYRPRGMGMNGPQLDPADAIYLAIQETFAQENALDRSATPAPAGATSGDGRDATARSELPAFGPREPLPRFAPHNDQFGALLKVVAQAGDGAAAAARVALEEQARLDAGRIGHLREKGAAGVAFAWASQRQAVVEDGTIQVDASAPGRVRITLTQCPFGFTGPDDAPACSLSNAYDAALAQELGVSAGYESRVTDGASRCVLALEVHRETPQAAPAADETPADGEVSEAAEATTARAPGVS